MTGPDVVVVDDVPGAAEDYAGLIASRTGLKVAATVSGDEALELARSGVVPVFVLDARMPIKSGVELFREIHEVDPRSRGILITGEATREEVGAGFGEFSAYLGKEEIERLPSVVLHEYVQHLESGVAESGPGTKMLLVKRTNWFSRDTVTYRLIRTVLLNDKYNHETDWQDLVVLVAGQQETTSTETVFTSGVTFESESSSRVAAKLGLSDDRLLKFTSELQSELTERSKYTDARTTSLKQTKTTVYSLPAPPTNPTDLHISLRRIQRAPEKLRFRIEILVTCTCCGSPKIIAESVVLKTGRVCLRQKDELSDGSRQTHHLGVS